MHSPAARLFVPAAFALVTAITASDADAKAAYKDLPGAVEAAEAIALVHTEATTTTEQVAGHWTYRQKVFANPTEALKGSLASPFDLLAQKDFICASVTYEAPADYLVFLARQDGHWTTVNHHMGALKIDGDQIEWPYAPHSEGQTKPLAVALAEVRALIGEPPSPEVVELPTVEAEDPEPKPCGYTGPVESLEEDEPTWPVVPLAMVGGAFAVMLGLGIGLRRRR